MKGGSSPSIAGVVPKKGGLADGGKPGAAAPGIHVTRSSNPYTICEFVYLILELVLLLLTVEIVFYESTSSPFLFVLIIHTFDIRSSRYLE